MRFAQNVLVMLFFPTEGYFRLKKGVNYIEAFILYALVCIVRIAQIFITHYPLASILPRDANFYLEIVRMLLPLISWVIACYALTTIMNGESHIGEVFVATAYSMLPYIILTIPVSVLSHVMSATDAGLYTFLQEVIWAWVLILFFMQVRDLNDYSFTDTLKICILALFSMLILWALAGLFYVLTRNIYEFLLQIFMEIKILTLG